MRILLTTRELFCCIEAVLTSGTPVNIGSAVLTSSSTSVIVGTKGCPEVITVGLKLCTKLRGTAGTKGCPEVTLAGLKLCTKLRSIVGTKVEKHQMLQPHHRQVGQRRVGKIRALITPKFYIKLLKNPSCLLVSLPKYSI